MWAKGPGAPLILEEHARRGTAPAMYGARGRSHSLLRPFEFLATFYFSMKSLYILFFFNLWCLNQLRNRVGESVAITASSWQAPNPSQSVTVQLAVLQWLQLPVQAWGQPHWHHDATAQMCQQLSQTPGCASSSVTEATKTFHKQPGLKLETFRGQCKGSQDQCQGWWNACVSNKAQWLCPSRRSNSLTIFSMLSRQVCGLNQACNHLVYLSAKFGALN